MDPVRALSDSIQPRVHDDPNSREAVRNGIATARGVRRTIIGWLENHPTETLTCEETHAFHPQDKHQATSAALNALWNEGILVRCGRRKNSEGNPEYEYDLSPLARSVRGLPPGRPAMDGTEPKGSVPSLSEQVRVHEAAARDAEPKSLVIEVPPQRVVETDAQPDQWYCTTCGGTKSLTEVRQTFGQYGEGVCPDCQTKKKPRSIFRRKKD